MGLKNKLKSRAIEVIRQPQIGPPPVIGEDISLFEAAYGKQRAPARSERDRIRFFYGEEAEAQLENLSEAQRAGWAVQAELANRREGSDV